MADKYVDKDAGGANNGTSQTDAWTDIQSANGLNAGDKCWIRRTYNTVLVADFAPTTDGTPSSPIEYIGWPRNSKSINCDWTNGDATVDNVDSNDMDREKHQGRYITGPDGEQYLITQIIDSNTFEIDREYAGATAANQDVTISADEDFADIPADPQNWSADADDLPIIDFNDANLNVFISGDDYFVFKNIEFKDSTDSGGIINFSGGVAQLVQGCLFKQTTENDPCIETDNCLLTIIRSIFEGSGSGSGQDGVGVYGGYLRMRDCALYNLGNHGIISTEAVVYLENVNIGVETGNGDDDISCDAGRFHGRDVHLGANQGDVLLTGTTSDAQVWIENVDKVLGDHKAWYMGGTFEKVAVAGETPNKKVSDNVIKISPNTDYQFIPEWAVEIFCHEFEATTDQKSYKYWLYNDTGDELNDSDADIGAKASIWLELEYVAGYDDTTEYVFEKTYSTETDIADAADADDWDFLSVNNITPAVASKVRIKCFCRHYTASGDIFIDPAVVIS